MPGCRDPKDKIKDIPLFHHRRPPCFVFYYTGDVRQMRSRLREKLYSCNLEIRFYNAKHDSAIDSKPGAGPADHLPGGSLGWAPPMRQDHSGAIHRRRLFRPGTAIAFLIRRLPSYQANIPKRLVKSPKVYWRDCGLLHALLNVPDERALLSQPWVGASWEGFVIEQALGELSSVGRNFSAYYFRTSDQHELDLVLDFGKELWAMEVKLTSSPNPEDMARLDKTADIIKASRRFLVSQTSRSSGDGHRFSCNLPTFLDHLREKD